MEREDAISVYFCPFTAYPNKIVSNDAVSPRQIGIRMTQPKHHSSNIAGSKKLLVLIHNLPAINKQA